MSTCGNGYTVADCVLSEVWPVLVSGLLIGFGIGGLLAMATLYRYYKRKTLEERV